MSSGTYDVDTASVLITIYAQGFIGLIEIVIFEIFKHEKDVYEPKRRCRKDRSPKVSLSSLPLSWILPLWSISEKDTLDMIGLDGYMFLRYIRMLTIIFLSIGTYSLVILFPVYYNNSNISIGINSITMANIKLGDNSLWASFISIWLFTLFFLYLFYKEYENFTKLRQNFMVNGDPDIPKQKLYSIMVENIPKRYQSSKQLKLLFEGLFPGEIETARIALDIKPLVDICDARRKNIIKLETIIATYEASDSVKLPTLSSLNNPALINKMLGHTEVDAIQFYVTEAQFFNQKFAILQREAEKVDLMSNNIYSDDLFADGITINDWALKFDDKHFTLKSITGTGFVTFRSIKSVVGASQWAVLDDMYPDLLVLPAPDPKDVIWENIPVKLDTIKFTCLCTKAMYYAGMLFWGVIIAAITAISSLSNLQKYIPVLRDLNPTLYAFLQGQLPVFAFILLMMLLPMFISFVATNIERRKTVDEVQVEVLHWYYYFQMMNVFYTLIAGTAFGSVTEIISNPFGIINFLASSLPGVSVVYINLLLTMLLSGVPRSFIRVIPTIKLIWYSRLSDEKKLTIRHLLEGCYEEEVIDYSNELPNILYILFITLIYWTIAPVITIIAGILFGAYYIQYKYQFCYVYVNNRETGGMYFPQMFRFSMQLLMLSSMVNISYMGLKLGKLQAPLMFPLPVVIYGVWSYILYKFDRVSKNASCRRAMAADIHHSRSGLGASSGTKKAYNSMDDSNIHKLKESNLPSIDKLYDHHDHDDDKQVDGIELVSLMAPHDAKDSNGKRRDILVDEWGSPYFADSKTSNNDDTIVGIKTNTNFSLVMKKKKNDGKGSVTSEIDVDMKNEKDAVNVDVKIDHHHDHNDACDVKDIDGNDNHDIKIELADEEEEEEKDNSVTNKSVDFYLPSLLLEPIILEPFMYRVDDDVPLFERESTSCLIDTIHLNLIYNEPREVSLDEIMYHYYSSDTIV